jgi:hypothetical protein
MRYPGLPPRRPETNCRYSPPSSNVLASEFF